MHIAQAKLGQASAGDNEVKLMMNHAPEWVQTSDPVIRSPARYPWTTALACIVIGERYRGGIVFKEGYSTHKNSHRKRDSHRKGIVIGKGIVLGKGIVIVNGSHRKGVVLEEKYSTEISRPRKGVVLGYGSHFCGG